MCVGKGMLIIRGEERPFYRFDSNDHSPLVEARKLKDDKPVEIRNFVRAELLPLSSLTGIDPTDWTVNWDETNPLPSWFEEDEEIWREKCINEMVGIIVPHWVRNGVGGSLDLRGTQIKDLGKVTVEGEIYK